MAEGQANYGYGKRPLWQWVLIYVIIGGIIYAAIYYFFIRKNGYSYSQNMGQSTQYQTQPAATVQSSPNMNMPQNQSMQEITVEGNEFAFMPSTISVKKGQIVKLTFKNTGKYPHNITFADLSVASKTIKPGEQDAIQFSADKTGSFTYTCTVDSHAEKGMKGTLTVQ